MSAFNVVIEGVDFLCCSVAGRTTSDAGYGSAIIVNVVATGTSTVAIKVAVFDQSAAASGYGHCSSTTTCAVVDEATNDYFECRVGNVNAPTTL